MVKKVIAMFHFITKEAQDVQIIKLVCCTRTVYLLNSSVCHGS